MSVRAPERREGKMKVINVANELLTYTIKNVLCKEKLFPKRSRWLMAGKLADLLNDFHSYVQTANEIRVVTPQEAEDRHRYNTLAHERNQLRNLKELVDKGERTMKNVREHYQSFVNYSALCSSDAPVREMDKFYARIFREKPQYKYKKRRKNYVKNKKTEPASHAGR